MGPTQAVPRSCTSQMTCQRPALSLPGTGTAASSPGQKPCPAAPGRAALLTQAEAGRLGCTSALSMLRRDVRPRHSGLAGPMRGAA